MKKNININKVLNDIKRNKRATKIVITNYKNWDILDGRTKRGRPFKKFAKAVDFLAYVIACGTVAFILTTIVLAWI